jgi:hypothetical protein
MKYDLVIYSEAHHFTRSLTHYIILSQTALPFTSPESFDRDSFKAAQIHLAGSQHRQGLDFDEVGSGRDEEVGETIGSELTKDLRDTGFIQRVQHSQTFALLLVRNAYDSEDLRIGAGGLLQCLFYSAMRDHFTTDLRETRKPVGDRHEPVFI